MAGCNPAPAQSVWVASTPEQLQQYFDLAQTQPIGTITYNGPTATIKTKLELPHKLYGASKMLFVYGNGATFIAGDSLKYVLGRYPASQTEANDTMQSQAFIISGFNVDGKGKANTGILLAASYNSEISHCDVTNCINGISLEFSMLTEISHCTVKGISGEGFIIRNGTWAGAALTNAGSNGSRIYMCKVFPSAGQTSCFSVYASSDCVLDGDIVDSHTNTIPMRGFKIDALSSTVVKDITIQHVHAESDVSVAMFDLNLAGGYADINHVYTQKTGPLISVNGTNYPHVYVDKVPVVPANVTFKTTGTGIIWSFSEVNADVSLTKSWSGGIKPYYWDSKRFIQSPYYQTSGDTLNGSFKYGGTVKINGKTPITQ